MRSEGARRAATAERLGLILPRGEGKKRHESADLRWSGAEAGGRNTMTATQAREMARRRRQIAKGMLRVSV